MRLSESRPGNCPGKGRRGMPGGFSRPRGHLLECPLVGGKTGFVPVFGYFKRIRAHQWVCVNFVDNWTPSSPLAGPDALPSPSRFLTGRLGLRLRAAGAATGGTAFAKGPGGSEAWIR